MKGDTVVDDGLLLPAPAPQPRSRTPWVVAAALIIVVIGIAAVVMTRTHDLRPSAEESPSAGLSPLGPPQGDPAPAIKLAKAMLGKAIFPTDARKTATPTFLSQPFSSEATPNLIDLHQSWMVPQPVGSAATFLAAHPPPGTSSDGTGESGGPNGPTSREVTDPLSVLPAGIGSAQLLFEVAAGDSGTSVVRVDAQVVFSPARSPQERVPTSISFVVVTRTGTLSPGSNGKGTITISDVPTIRHLAGLLDGLPAATPGMSSCPPFSIQYEIAFHTKPEGPAALVATIGPCATVTLVVHGAPLQPALSDRQGVFTPAVIALLNQSP